MHADNILSSLTLVHFRNLAEQKLQFGPGIHFVSGANGAGKTNLLDAIYYLCSTRSHFSYGDAAAVAHQHKWLRLAGVFMLGGKTEHITLKMQPRKGKTIERNKVAYTSLIEHIGLLPVVMISPADIELAIGGPEERRRFIDQTIAQYDQQYLRALVTYNKLLKLRNALLKAAAHPLEIDLTLLATYDAQLAAPARLIHAARISFVEELEPLFAELYQAISGGAERPGVSYESRLHERPYQELLMQSRDQDTYLKRTNVGPHRDELALLLNGESLRRYASQGQLKSVLLALRLAQSRMLRAHQEKTPLLLLDDLFDRLDPQRVQALINLVQAEQYAQIIVTDTHAERLRQIDVEATAVHYYHVEEGVVGQD